MNYLSQLTFKQTKSVEQVRLSNATRNELFALQEQLYIKYSPKQTFLQRLLGGMKHVSR